MTAPSLSKHRVAIFEDNATNRDRWTSLVNLCGGTAVPVVDRAPKLNDLKTFFEVEKITLLMSDHHLFEHSDYAGYYGAEAVAVGYRSGVGGILVTGFEKTDADLSLRQHRRWIPALIHSTALSHKNLTPALLQADLEVRQKLPARERIPHRSIMTVRRVETRGTYKIVKVVMSQWDASTEVGFPLEMVPEKIRPAMTPGNLIIAQVNIETDRAEDLYFDQFELPDSDVLERAKTLFNRP